MFSENEKVGYKQIICLDKEINDKRRCKTLLKSLDSFYEEYLYIRHFIGEDI